MDLFHLKGIGPARAAGLRAVGICSLRDLLYTFPLRYEDHSTLSPCSARCEGHLLVRGTVARKPVFQSWHGKTKVTASIQDESGILLAQWFNAPWMREHLREGETVKLYGRMSLKGGRPVLQNPRLVTDAGLVPVYRPVAGFTPAGFRKLVQAGLAELTQDESVLPETLPLLFREAFRLCSLGRALRAIHGPVSMDELAEAQRRLTFEDMLWYLLFVSGKGTRRKAAAAFRVEETAPEAFWKTLPFAPTGAQRRALLDIYNDCVRPLAMARMVQGDVGCGKTVIAFGAIYLAFRSGFQAAMMAPTEILARQHFENARAILEPLGMTCAMLTGSTSAKARRLLLSDLAEGRVDALFGTQALFSAGVNYARLGLVITDEQHRFGVNQRALLQKKGMEGELFPHVLVMSATPIPRSLALVLYGDLDLTIVDEMPAGRQPVQTRIVTESRRDDLYEYTRQRVQAGDQAYVVCPLVEDTDTEPDTPTQAGLSEARSAKAVFDELISDKLPGLRVGLTWGSQPAEEKAETLRRFMAGELDVLVSTTVIEVGVNNPNATIMIIENAGRFGLSQLHQLRGRVGRGRKASWCFLISDQSEKLRILTQTTDGFIISQKDLELRGPGDLVGTRQAGEAAIGGVLHGDYRLLDEVTQCVRQLRHDALWGEILPILESRAEAFFEHVEVDIS